MTTTHTYEIHCGRDADAVHGRAAAVQRARSLSARTRRPVLIERSDGRVSMEFRRGSLQTYMLQTHGRRR